MLILNVPISDIKAKVVGSYLDETQATTVSGEMPQPENQAGKNAVLYLNPTTGLLFYEYEDRPLTEQERVTQLEERNNLLKAAIDDQLIREGRVNPATGLPWLPTPVSEVPLDIAKAAKLAELRINEAGALATFRSSALGTEHIYLSGLSDMLLLTGQYAFVKGDDYDGSDISWYTVEAGNTPHTSAQFVQMYLDARTNVSTVKYHRATLEYQVSIAATVAEVDAIVW